MRYSAPIIAALFAITTFTLGENPARADSTCTALLAQKAQAALQNNQWYDVELTMHRENVAHTTYSKGYLAPSSDGIFHGYANQLFSDRKNNAGQPFDLPEADDLDLTLSPSGQLHIHYWPWNFETTFDLECKGSMLTAYVPSWGIVTLSFRQLFRPIG